MVAEMLILAESWSKVALNFSLRYNFDFGAILILKKEELGRLAELRLLRLRIWKQEPYQIGHKRAYIKPICQLHMVCNDPTQPGCPALPNPRNVGLVKPNSLGQRRVVQRQLRFSEHGIHLPTNLFCSSHHQLYLYLYNFTITNRILVCWYR